MSENLIIRSIESVQELEEVRQLESLIWSELESYPVSQTITAVKNGGMVIGAFLENQLIGFQYSFAGFDGHKPYLCSQTLGIHPDFRKMGIGEKLKCKQREEAIKKGYDLITWTYDPMETVNGHLNLHKLGAECSTYIENCYGDMPDALNIGMPSDRFVVEWRIKDRQERNQNYHQSVNLLNNESHLLIKTGKNSDGFLVPEEIDLSKDQDEESLFVPVSSDFQSIKQYNLDLALSWRMKTRQVFTHYFKHGWSAVDLVRNESDPDICFYVLKQINS
ncbi:GNAT family N-acetyltransferase [Scopulibacillus cellulosilyticus]|uniref:GNAT family N-acetyltransferase n=1 Tax=Scopulibacillus cellulosilyticus TaxID=2665665 RepID=A0ABW2PZS0_9BACL